MISPITADDPVLVAQERGEVFKLLALCFYRPTQELANDIAQGSLAAVLRNLLESLEAEGWEESIAAIEGYGDQPEGLDAEGLYSALKEEYTRLFIGGSHHLPVPPYESVYRQDVPELERGLVMGRSTVDARRQYAEAGLELSPDFTDLPDHIAVELEFMYFLCNKEAEEWKQGNSEAALQRLQNQKEFLAEHLLKWIPGFRESLNKAASLDFYRVMAGVTQEYIHLEHHRLDELIEKTDRR